MSSIQPKFCPHCGMKLDAEDAFCRRCGNKIEKELKVITPPLVPEKTRIPAPSVRKRTVRRKKTRDPVVTGFYIVLELLCCAIVITLTVTNIQERRVATARTVGDRISVVMTPPPTPSPVPAPCSHQWQEATCITAKTCILCGEKEGTALWHQYGNDNRCVVCGALYESPTSTTAPYEAQEETASHYVTLGEKNALSSALSYLKHMAFSKEGLIEQLEYEGYSYSEAKYAADNCGANWKEQAAKCAANYLSHMPFSRQGLIEQLEYEGFTHEQAVYGVTQAGY